MIRIGLFARPVASRGNLRGIDSCHRAQIDTAGRNDARVPRGQQRGMHPPTFTNLWKEHVE